MSRVELGPIDRTVGNIADRLTGKMVDKFVGTWKMISSENFDDYMKALGMIYLSNLKLLIKYECI